MYQKSNLQLDKNLYGKKQWDLSALPARRHT